MDVRLNEMEGNIARQQRLELINCLANTSLDFLKRLHDGTPVWQRYRDGEVLHAHYMTSRQPMCLRWRRRTFAPLEFLFHPDEFPMPVGVGEFAEKLEWLPSVVRLKPLEKCEMFIGYSSEVSGAVLPEAIWRAFKRKLDAVGNSARLLLGKSTGQVIECVAQAARELAYDDADFRGENIAGLWQKREPLLVGGEIRIGMNNEVLQPFQVFLCPREECFDFLELVEHAALIKNRQS